MPKLTGKSKARLITGSSIARNLSGRSIGISDPLPEGLPIIDFDGIPDQDLDTNGAVIPGTGGRMKIYLGGTCTARIQDEKLELKQTAPQNDVNNFVLAGHDQDLNLLRTGPQAGTWKLRYKFRLDSGIDGVGPMPIILGRLATSADVSTPFQSDDATIWGDFVGSGRDLYVLRFQNTSNNLQTFASVNKGNGFQGVERIYTIEKTGGPTAKYIWTLDEGGADTILLGAVVLTNQPTSEFILWGHSTGGFNTRNDPTTTKFLTDIELA